MGGLPLAVRLVGRYLCEQEEDCSDYLVWLRATPLAALELGARRESGVPLLLERSMAQVSADARHALAAVGLLAQAPFERGAVAAALELEPEATGRLLGELVNYGLLLRRGERYEVSHALVHTYAWQRYHDPAAATRVAQRLAAHFTALARREIGRGPAGHPQLNAERVHLLATLQGCSSREDWDAVQELAALLQDYLDLQGPVTARIAVAEAGLAAARARGDPAREGEWLRSLGAACTGQGRSDRALVCYRDALVLARSAGDRKAEGDCLGNLGSIYLSREELEQAIDHTDRALAISREVGDRRGECTRLGNLGVAHRRRDELDLATRYFGEALDLARAIGDQRAEGNTHSNLGNILSDRGHMKEAAASYERALAISREIGDRPGEAKRLGNLGIAYRALGRTDDAFACSRDALELAREIGERQIEITTVSNLGNAYRAMEQLELAIDLFHDALEMATQIGNRRHQCNAWGNLGEAYADLGERERAIQCHEKAVALARELGTPRLVALQSWDLGWLLLDTDPERALELMSLRVAYEREIGHADAERHAEELEQLRTRKGLEESDS